MKLKTHTKRKDLVQGDKIEEVNDYKYLGSFISAESNIENKISTRIGLAASSFNRLNNVWKYKNLHFKTENLQIQCPFSLANML